MADGRRTKKNEEGVREGKRGEDDVGKKAEEKMIVERKVVKKDGKVDGRHNLHH